MTTKITVDPALVREVIPVFSRYADIEILDISDEFIWLQHPNMPQISFTQMGLKCIADNKGIYNVGIFDIHRFKDMAIEWCAGKGWWLCEDVYVSRDDMQNRVTGKVTMGDMDETQQSFEWGGDNEYPDKLSAELAAINFVHEQIQKEKKDGNQ